MRRCVTHLACVLCSLSFARTPGLPKHTLVGRWEIEGKTSPAFDADYSFSTDSSFYSHPRAYLSPNLMVVTDGGRGHLPEEVPPVNWHTGTFKIEKSHLVLMFRTHEDVTGKVERLHKKFDLRLNWLDKDRVRMTEKYGTGVYRRTRVVW